MNKRGIDTSLLNFIISVFAIALIIGILYLWMSTITVNRQENALRANLALFNLDTAVSGWVADTPNLASLDFKGLSDSFNSWATSHGYTADSFSCDYHTLNKGDQDVVCDFSLSKAATPLSGTATPSYMMTASAASFSGYNYQRWIILPTPSGVKKLLLRSS